MCTSHCGKLKVGDKGQRYQVTCLQKGNRVVVGWTDREDGQPFVDMISKHPSMSGAEIIDRKPA